ncbi:MAG: iron-containing alcohol dehydrogenase [Acidobacteria bacterium]|nr:iron-containing alcohol dehydrogenase [Acidobacteriota bacterium]
MNPIEQYVDEAVTRAWQAAQAFRRFDQEQVDRVVEAVFEAGWNARHELARLAIEETQMGVLEHKVIKNSYASLLVYEDIRPRRTVGVICHDAMRGISEVAQPKGPVLATIPVTNPTSTTIFKTLICMKTRNPVIFSPHRGARKCIKEAARILSEAAHRAGAPEHAVQFLSRSQGEYVERLMRHPKLALILATGTSSIVRAAQASGTPTLGVGPGNVPVYVHASADIPLAARYIIFSKTFDNSTVCGSEQAIVVEPHVERQLRPLLEKAGAFFCTAAQMRALGSVCVDVDRRRMRAEVVGQPAPRIAELAGLKVPPETSVLVAEPGGIGPEHPLSYEILAPVLAFYRVESYAQAYATCEALNHWGGAGHTVGVYANDDRVVEDFAKMNAGRILVNTPSTQGAIGGTFNTLRPSLTLACGTFAGNLFTDNISTDHLLNIHRVARLRPNDRWLDTTRDKSLDPSVDAKQARGIYNRNY